MTINQIIALAINGDRLPDHVSPVRAGLNACRADAIAKEKGY